MNLMILHLKSPNVICINQQSDLLMYSSRLFQRHVVSHIKMEGMPPVTSTQLNVPKTGRFPQGFILCSKIEQCFYLFRRIEALLQGFLVLLRSILSEPGDEKNLSSGLFVFFVFFFVFFLPVKIQSGLLSYRC